MTETNPSPDPCNRKASSQGISVFIPANLFDHLEQRARMTGESVVSLASRLVREALKSMPQD